MSDKDQPNVEVICQNVADIKGTSVYQDRLCVHPCDWGNVVLMCISGGGHDVLDELADRGCRVAEISMQNCEKQNHDFRVYIEPFDGEIHDTEDTHNNDLES